MINSEKLNNFDCLFNRFLISFFSFPDMTRDEAYSLMQDCVKEIQKRLIINLPSFQVQLIDKDGIKKMDNITVKNLP